MSLKIRSLLLLLIAAIFITSCKKWDDHIEVNDPLLTENLLEQINKNPELSLFSEYLKATKQDSVLASSKAFTVWAPTNDALKALSPDVVNDINQLTRVIRNHISNQSYYAASVKDTLRIRALNGKNVFFSKTLFEDANIVKSDIGVGNGVLHIVDKVIVPKLNIWEYVQQEASVVSQKNLILSFNGSYRDYTKAVLLGYDASGNAIYKDGTGVINYNTYLQKDSIDNEDKLYTYFVLNETALAAEKTKLAPYFKVYDSGTLNTTASARYTDSAAVYNLAVKGLWTIDKLPDTLYSSRDSVKIAINKDQIEKSYRASNGIVYVMKSISYNVASKLKNIIIQGEDNYVLQSSKTVQRRVRRNAFYPTDPKYKTTFTDILIENHGVSGFWVKYTPNTKFNSVKYKVYVRAVRDFNLVPATGRTDLDYFRERIAFRTNTATDLDYFTVNAKRVLNADPTLPPTFEPIYDEYYVGEYTSTEYGIIPTFLVANNVTTNGLNTLVLDYIKLVPVP